jgi:hypothetical protein
MCIFFYQGAIDGKHVRIKCPKNGGSKFFNHYKFHSIVLMAICDAEYKFLWVDVGAYGSNSDGGVLANSDFGKRLAEKTLNIPGWKVLPGTNVQFPHFFIGDEAFALSESMMRPYSGQNLSEEQEFFNTWISSVRKTVEDIFGQLTSKFRIFHQTVFFEPLMADLVVKATTVLHNFLKTESTSTTFSRKSNEFPSDKMICTMNDGNGLQIGENTSITSLQMRDCFSKFLKQRQYRN